MNRKTFLSDGVRICIEDWIKFYRTLAGTESCPWWKTRGQRLAGG